MLVPKLELECKRKARAVKVTEGERETKRLMGKRKGAGGTRSLLGLLVSDVPLSASKGHSKKEMQ